MAEKNSLWKNIRKKAEQNRRTGNKPKEPTKEMLDQERKIKAKQYYNGGPTGNDEDDKIIDPADYLISKVIMNRSKDQNLDQTTPINNNEDGAPYKPLSIPMEGYELPEGEDYTPYKSSSVPMEGYEVDPSFYNTPSKTETTKASNKTENKKPVNKPENKKPENNKPVNKPNNVKSNTENFEISPYTRFLLDSYKYKNQNSQNSQYTEPRYIAERDDTSTRLSPAMSTKEWKEGPRSFGPTLKDLDVVTDVMQLGNFVPHPAGQIIGQLGNWGGAAIDSYQAYDDYNEGNYGSMAANIGSAVLGAYLGGKGYRRDMSNTVPGSMADKIASFGSRSGSYRPLTALPRLRNNAVIQKGLNYNRSLLGGLGLETIYDSNDYFETGNGYLLPEIVIYGDKIKPEERLIKVEGRERYDGGGDVPPISIEDYLKVYEDALRVDRILKANKNYKPRSEYSISLDPRSDTKTYLDYLKKSRDDFNTNYNSKKRKKELNNILSIIQQGKEGKRPKEYTEEEWAEELKNAERDYKYNYWATPDDYYKEVSPNSFYQRELNTLAMNPDLPMMYYDKRITPTKYNIYDDLGESLDTYGVYTYDPIVLKEEILKNYPNSEELLKTIENPTLETSKTKTSKIDIPYLPSKTFEGFKSPEPSFNLTPTTLTSSTPADNMWDGTFQKYKRATYEDPVYRVWLPNQQMQIMSEEDFKKLGNLNLKNLDEKAQGGYVDGDDDKKKKTRVYTDPREFRIAQQNYNDSLAVSNQSQILIDAYNRARGTNTGLSGTEYERVKSDNPNPNAAISRLNKPKPISRYNINITDSKRPDLNNIKIYKEPEVIPVFRKPEIELIPSKPYKGESTEPTIIPTPPNVDFGKPNLDNFFEGTYEKYKRSPYEDPMYRVWISGQQQQIVPESEFKKLSDQYLLKDLDAPDPGGNLYDKPKATGGYIYDGGGPTKFYKKTQYDPKTGETLEYYGTEDNKYYRTPNTPKGIAFESTLPEFEYIEDTGLYNPDIVGPTAPKFIPSETGLILNPNYQPPASGRAEPTMGPIEAALFAPVAGAIASKAVPAVASTLQLPAVVGGRTIPWLTGNNILGLTGGLSGANMLGSDINSGYYSSNAPWDEKLARGLETGLFLSGSPGVISGLGMGLNTAKTGYRNYFKNNFSVNPNIPINPLQKPSLADKRNFALWQANEDAATFSQSPYNRKKLSLFRTNNEFNLSNQKARFANDPELVEPFNRFRDFENAKEPDPFKQVADNPKLYLEDQSGNISQGKYGIRDIGDKDDIIVIDPHLSPEDTYLTGIHETAHSRTLRDLSTLPTVHERKILDDAWSKGLKNQDGTYVYKNHDAAHYEAEAVQNELRMILNDKDGSRVYYPKDDEDIKNALQYLINQKHPYVQSVNDFDISKIRKSLNKIGFAGTTGVVIGTTMKQNLQPEQQSQGGYMNPYMYYAGGPIQYKRGGVLEDVGKLWLNYMASPLEQISGNNFVNFNYNNKGFANAAAVMEGVAGAGTDIAGSIFLPGVYGQAKGAIQGVTKNLGHSQEYQRGADKWANKTGQIASSAGNLTSGIMSGNPQQIIGGAGQVLGTLGSEFGSKELNAAGQLVGMGSQFVNPSQGMPSTTPSVDSNINNFQSPAMYPDQMLNQGLSFAATGGNINNKLVNLQRHSMKNRYKDYRTKYKQGGIIQDKLEANNIYEIPSYVGKHYQHPDGGMPIGPNASVEAKELVRMEQGGPTGVNTPTYVDPATVNGTNSIMMPQMTSDYKMITDKNGMPKFTDKSPAQWLKEKLAKRNSPFRVEVDRFSEPSNQQVMNIAEGGREVAVSVNELKQQAAQEDAMRIAMADNVAAYGGYLSKYRNLNMPKSKAKGGPMVSNVAQPFQVAAQNRGGMMMAQGGNMYDPCPDGYYWDEDEGRCVPMAEGLPSRENIYSNPAMLRDIERLNYKRAKEEYKQWYREQGKPKDMPDPYFTSPKNFVLPDKWKNKNYYPREGEWDEDSKKEFNKLFNPVQNEYEQKEKIKQKYLEGNPAIYPRNDEQWDYFKDGINRPKQFDYDEIPKDDPSQQYKMNEDELRDFRYEDWCPCFKMVPAKDPSREIAGKPVLKKVCVPCEEDSDNSNMLMANGGMMQQSGQQDQMMQMMQQVQEMLMQGANPQELLKQLMKSGLPQDQAQQLVQAAMQDLQSQQQPQQFQMARGGKIQYAPGGKTEENWFDEPAYTKAFRYAPLIPSAAAIATGLQNKKRTLTPSLLTAPQIDLERARINLREESRRGLDTALRTFRGGSGSSGQLFGNTASAIHNYNKNMAANLSKLYQDEETTNAQYKLQSLLSNQQHLNDFKTKNEEMFQNAQNVALKGTQEGVLGLQKALQDERAQKLQEFIAKYRMNTRSYGLDSKGRDIYLPPKDYLTEEDIDLNTNDMWDYE